MCSPKTWKPRSHPQPQNIAAAETFRVDPKARHDPDKGPIQEECHIFDERHGISTCVPFVLTDLEKRD